MSQDEIALLKAIQAKPDIDLPRLIYADFLEEQSRNDHDAAVAEFIRLSCDGRPPRRADGSLFPMKLAAADWLEADNWRRLLPRLCQDWDEAMKIMKRRDEAEMRAIEQARQQSLQRMEDATLAAFGFVMQSMEYLPPLCYFTKVDTPRGEYRVSVPFFMGGKNRSVQTYTVGIRLRFQRGFVAYGSWKAPMLGKLVAQRLAYDQPLALTVGPGRIQNVFEYLAVH
jgi:uncharacterized protein (TIGR02996 family)